jgi:shikimate kinase
VASPEVVHDRISKDESGRERPLLQVEDPGRRIVELMTERDQDYARFHQVSTDDAQPDQVADEIARLWREPG